MRPKYLDDAPIAVPSLALERIQLELDHMADWVRKMLAEFKPAIERGDHEGFNEIVKHNDRVVLLRDQILDKEGESMRRMIPKIFYLILAVTALGFPIVFAVMWWVARILEFDVSILELATGSLLLTVLADLFLAIANDRFNKRPEAKLHQLNEPIGDEAIVADRFTLRGTTSIGRVKVQGQVWTAQCDTGELLESGRSVKVTHREGLTLFVAPIP